MPTPSRPNILYIMTDQQRYDCVGANGNSFIQTPNIDALADESANFHSCFVQSPVCVPSRQTFFTGRYAHSHRNRVNYTPLDPSEVLMQQRLKDADYSTGFVGKLHYWPPTREHALSTGFDMGLIHDAGPTDEYSDYVSWISANSEFTSENYRDCIDNPDTRNPHTAKIPEEFHETTWCGVETRRMLREMASEDEPFFLFSSYWKPHSSFELPEPWASMYNDIDIPLPDTGDMEYIESLPFPLQRIILRAGNRDYDISREELMWEFRAYYGAVSQIDHEVGQTLELLRELDLEDNTIVVFCSDHGDLLREHSIGGKNVFFEGSIHVPMMIRQPGIVLPDDVDDLIESTDVMSTLFELSGVPVPVSNQGRSFAQRMTDGVVGSTYTEREYVYGENIIPEVITTGKFDFDYTPGVGIKDIRHPDAKMVRSKRWKYCYYVGNGEELYDLQTDPGELTNRADDPACADIVKEMKSAMLDWLITADETDQIAPHWLSE
jgi:arylsulfatase